MFTWIITLLAVLALQTSLSGAGSSCPDTCFRRYRQASNACFDPQNDDLFKNCCVHFCQHEDGRTGYACAQRDTPLTDPVCPDTFRRTRERAEKDCAAPELASSGCSVELAPGTNRNGKSICGYKCTSSGPGDCESGGDGSTGGCNIEGVPAKVCPLALTRVTGVGPDNTFRYDPSVTFNTMISISFFVGSTREYDASSVSLQVGSNAAATMSCVNFADAVRCQVDWADVVPEGSIDRNSLCCETVTIVASIGLRGGTKYDATETDPEFFTCVPCADDDIDQCDTSTCPNSL